MKAGTWARCCVYAGRCHIGDWEKTQWPRNIQINFTYFWQQKMNFLLNWREPFFFFELNDDVDFILHTTSNESMKLTSIAPTLSQTKKKTKWNQLPQSNEFRKYIENKYRFMSTIELPFRSNKRTEYMKVLDSNNRINYIQNLPFEGATATQTNQI